MSSTSTPIPSTERGRHTAAECLHYNTVIISPRFVLKMLVMMRNLSDEVTKKCRRRYLFHINRRGRGRAAASREDKATAISATALPLISATSIVTDTTAFIIVSSSTCDAVLMAHLRCVY